MLRDRVDPLRDLCAGWVESGHTPALAVCVARRGVIVLDEAFGRLRPEQGSPPIEKTSLFPIASITKPMTATLVMQLVEEGLLGLNRPVRDYIPEVKCDGAEDMLVHHLLTHTSGYVWYDEEPMLSHMMRRAAEGFRMPVAGETEHPLAKGLLEICYDAPLIRKPGELMTYSNHNYELLAEIVRRLTRRPLWELARERLFAPLGMDDSYHVVPESESHRVVQRPPEAPMGSPQSPFMQGFGSRQWQETPLGGAGVFSTARDLAVFGQMFLNRGRYGAARILSPASVAAMTRDQIPGIAAQFIGREISPASWGYGWGIESSAKWRYYRGSLAPLGTFDHGGHGGSMLWVDPKHDIVGAYLEVVLHETGHYIGELLWNFDLFQNAVYAALGE
jgi:CubicO group peptidase (beta-lactamase class C family)